MIKSVRVTNPKNESLLLELSNPDPSGLIVQQIEGLGPGKADINIGDFTLQDGGVYNSARMSPRNITITLKPLDIPSVEQNRIKIYKYFQLKKKTKILVDTDTRKVETEGYIESIEPDIFSDDETVVISIICPDPYLYEQGGASTVFSGVAPLFEFPFENNSTTENLIEFGEIRLDTRATLNYKGDMDTGVVVSIAATGECSNITIYNVDTLEYMKIDVDKIKKITGKAFGDHDELLISTYPNNKYVRLLRDGFLTNVITAINKNADWFKLSSGDNVFSFSTDDGEGEKNLIVTFSYRNAYGGV